MSGSDVVPCLTRALAILSLLRSSNTPRRISELATQLQIPRSSAYHIVEALIAERFLKRVGRGHVKLGSRSVDLFLAKRRLLPNTGTTPGNNPAAELWDQPQTSVVNCARHRRFPPYRIGFSNALGTNPWRIALLNGMLSYARRHSTSISDFVVVDAQDSPGKQRDDIRMMLRNRLDILLVSCTQAAAMDEVLAEVASVGLPVVVVDRRPRSDENFLTYVCASDVALGRITAQWLAETLKGKGRIFVLTGTEGTSPTERRMAAAKEVFKQYPEISVAAARHTNWREEVGREVMHGLLRENGIPDGVWCDSGLQGAGSIQAFLDSGIPAQRIPPHTGGDVNHVFQLAVQHRVPLAAVEYPACMGARAVRAALDILAGKSISRLIELHSRVIVSRGWETISVHPDIFADDYVRWDRSAEFVASVEMPA